LTQSFDEVIKISPPKIVAFLVLQQKALSHKPKGRRWSKSIIRICLTLWCRSQKCYKELRDSNRHILSLNSFLRRLNYDNLTRLDNKTWSDNVCNILYISFYFCKISLIYTKFWWSHQDFSSKDCSVPCITAKSFIS
jgi:hypothetical protein